MSLLPGLWLSISTAQSNSHNTVLRSSSERLRREILMSRPTLKRATMIKKIIKIDLTTKYENFIHPPGLFVDIEKLIPPSLCSTQLRINPIFLEFGNFRKSRVDWITTFNIIIRKANSDVQTRSTIIDYCKLAKYSDGCLSLLKFLVQERRSVHQVWWILRSEVCFILTGRLSTRAKSSHHTRYLVVLILLKA